MYCSKCGHANTDDATFCSQCGATLGSAAANVGSVSRPADDGTGFDEEAWRAVIGPRNIDYYLPRFREQHATGRRARWHWPALFVTFYWLLYRKMWLWAVGYFVVPYIIAIILGIVVGALAAMMGAEGATMASGLTLACSFVLFLVPPLFANGVYYAHCKTVIEKHRRTAETRDRFLGQLEGRGGTSAVALVLVAIFMAVAVIGIVAAIALPAYQDYTKRAKSSEAIVSAMVVARQVGDYVERTKSIPSGLSEFAPHSGASKYISGMRLNPEDGIISVDIVFGPSLGGGTVFLVPKLDSNGRVSWACRAATDFRRYAPISCRGG